MTTLTVRLPDSLHKEIKQLAKTDGVSINQFLTLAAAEKVSALRTIDHLRAEAAKAVAMILTHSSRWCRMLTPWRVMNYRNRNSTIHRCSYSVGTVALRRSH